MSEEKRELGKQGQQWSWVWYMSVILALEFKASLDYSKIILENQNKKKKDQDLHDQWKERQKLIPQTLAGRGMVPRSRSPGCS